MAFKMSTEIRDGYILCVTTGEIRTADDILEKVEVLRRVGKREGFFRFLMEERRLRLLIDAHEISIAANLLEREGIQTIGGRMATLYNPDYPDAFRLQETMYMNRSLSYRLFREEAEALVWLMR
ncbi:hypothetical protein [Pseudodesulfovibrio indicus]|uniref:hypothetical protein n=1 Tax=Pseudodesulfovibrio indicus TaxID=1716143 RepID=UPI00292DEEFD|nr:hypothetical protein [Pseudodesulfovibrio indicus]